MELSNAAAHIGTFSGESLREKIAGLEKALTGARADQVTQRIPVVKPNLLDAAVTLKEVSGQINVFIHVIGILLSLPHILDETETIESLSLGAGNTGRDFDLVTDRRIAEFKFMQWRGGSETIRQNAVFKDFFELAEADTQKRRVLYVLGLDQPMKFLEGGRAIASVLSRNQRIRDDFRAIYGHRFTRVHEYYEYRRERVEILDLAELVPVIAQAFGM